MSISDKISNISERPDYMTEKENRAKKVDFDAFTDEWERSEFMRKNAANKKRK